MYVDNVRSLFRPSSHVPRPLYDFLNGSLIVESREKSIHLSPDPLDLLAGAIIFLHLVTFRQQQIPLGIHHRLFAAVLAVFVVEEEDGHGVVLSTPVLTPYE